MRKLILTLTAAAFALVGSLGYAQTHSTSEDMAAPSKKATKEEKAAAKAHRRATSKEVSKSDEGRVDKPEAAGPKVKVSKEEKAKAKAKRKEAGTQAAKEGSGRLEDEGGQKK